MGITKEAMRRARHGEECAVARGKLLALGGVLLLCTATACNTLYPNLDGSKFKEVERLSVGVPTFPGSVRVGEKAGASKPSSAYVGSKYKCADNHYESIKQFYLQSLAQSGWEFTGERQLYQWDEYLGGRALDFRKGEYKVVVEYAGERANKGWDYSVAVEWHK
jgi:hypothetical protein